MSRRGENHRRQRGENDWNINAAERERAGVCVCALLPEDGEDLRVAVQLVLLFRGAAGVSVRSEPHAQRAARLASSPTLMGTPPNAGRTTRSPSLTLTGLTWPSLPGAPGPTARTVPSGGGPWVAAEGRYNPDAVFSTTLARWMRTRSSKGARDLIDLIERDCHGRGGVQFSLGLGCRRS
jgi:hypothetical protein